MLCGRRLSKRRDRITPYNNNSVVEEDRTEGKKVRLLENPPPPPPPSAAAAAINENSIRLPLPSLFYGNGDEDDPQKVRRLHLPLPTPSGFLPPTTSTASPGFIPQLQPPLFPYVTPQSSHCTTLTGLYSARTPGENRQGSYFPPFSEPTPKTILSASLSSSASNDWRTFYESRELYQS